MCLFLIIASPVPRSIPNTPMCLIISRDGPEYTRKAKQSTEMFILRDSENTRTTDHLSVIRKETLAFGEG